MTTATQFERANKVDQSVSFKSLSKTRDRIARHVLSILIDEIGEPFYFVFPPPTVPTGSLADMASWSAPHPALRQTVSIPEDATATDSAGQAWQTQNAAIKRVVLALHGIPERTRTALLMCLKPLNPMAQSGLQFLFSEVSNLKAGLIHEKKNRVSLLRHIKAIAVPPIPSVLKERLEVDCTTAVATIEQALNKLDEAERLFDPLQASWIKRPVGNKALNSPPAVLRAADSLMNVLMRKHKFSMRKSARLAARVLRAYVPDLETLDERAVEKFSERLRIGYQKRHPGKSRSH